MIFHETSIPGAYLIDIKRIEDERGYFARAWCQNEFRQNNLKYDFVQTNVGFSKCTGTLRGMHFQNNPYQEVKLIRCTRGAVYDVAVDLRANSPTYKKWLGVELNEDNSSMLYIPEGCAHGYLTLADNSEICYMTTQFYMPEYAAGVRFNDPAFGIQWPIKILTLSEKDLNWPEYI